MHPKNSQVYDQGPAQKTWFFRRFHIQDRVMDSSELKQ